jgi:hypothetical protein
MFKALGKWASQRLLAEGSPAGPRRRPGFRPWCEVLEDRRLLAGIASHLVITGFPLQAGPGLAGSLTVQAQDPAGNIDMTDNGTVTIYLGNNSSAPVLLTQAMINGTTGPFMAAFQQTGTQELFATEPRMGGVILSGSFAAVGIQNTDVSSSVYHPRGSDPGAPLPTPLSAVYGSNPTGVSINGEMFTDFKIENASSNDTAIVVFTIPAGVTAPKLKFFDTSNSTWEPVSGSTLVGPQGGTGYQLDQTADTITVSFDSSSFPAVNQLTGTVFTIAISGATSATVTVGVFPALASNESLPAVSASFTSSSSLSLTLTPLQQGAITTSNLSTNTGGGDGSSDAEAQAVWDYLDDFWRWMLLGMDQPPSRTDMDAAIGLGADAKPAGTAAGAGIPAPAAGKGGAATCDGVKAAVPSSPENHEPNEDAREAFFATAPSTAELPGTVPRLPEPTDPVIEWGPVTTDGERYGSLALLGLPGLGLMREEIQWHLAPQQ